MYAVFLTLYILLSVALIVLVLIQHGKGADIGAAFGSGASNTVFGSQGAGGFLFRLTGGLAIAFFLIALGLGYMVNTQYQQQIAAPVLPGVVVKVPTNGKDVKKNLVPLPDDVLPVKSGTDTIPAP